MNKVELVKLRETVLPLVQQYGDRRAYAQWCLGAEALTARFSGGSSRFAVRRTAEAHARALETFEAIGRALGALSLPDAPAQGEQG